MLLLILTSGVFTSARIAGTTEPDPVSLLCTCSRINFAERKYGGTTFDIQAEINFQNLKCRENAERLRWNPIASIYIGNVTTILDSGTIKCSDYKSLCQKNFSFTAIPPNQNIIVWIQTKIDDFNFCQPIVMPTASVQITPNYSLETIQQESQPSKSSFQPSSFGYVIFVASFLILLMIAFVVWFNFFRKRREAKAKLNITPDAASSLESLMESPLRLSHTLDRDIVVVAMPNQGETRFLQLFNEIKSRSNVRLVIPENCEMDIFKNMDIWISNCIKKYQRFLVLLTLDLVSDEDVSCSSPFCEVKRILFRRLLLNVNSTEEITKKRLFYIFLDPPVDILHYASQGLTESQPYKHTYDLSQEGNCLDQTSRLLSDLMNSF